MGVFESSCSNEMDVLSSAASGTGTNEHYESGQFSSAIQTALNGNNIEEEWDEDDVLPEKLPFQNADDFEDSGFVFEEKNEQCLKERSCQENTNDTPKKAKLNQSNFCSQDPLTPTANLKILLHAASPEIRNYERRKLLFTNSTSSQDKSSYDMSSKNVFTSSTKHDKDVKDRIETSSTSEFFKNPVESEKDPDVENTFEHTVHKNPSSCDRSNIKAKVFNRKEKSLGLLCRRFLRLYPEHPKENISICLDDAAKRLTVGRRRIYDIINVLESIKIVNRLAKNNYTWRGRNGLTRTLTEIRREAEESGFAEILRVNFLQYQDFKPLSKNECTSASPSKWSFVDSDPAKKRRDKSLGLLSKKFVTLFIVQPGQLVSLEMAARVLITHGQSAENKYKTKIRRLYDIANILSSLKLIKKIHTPGRKPAFRWTGPQAILPPTSPKQSHSRDCFTSPVSDIWSSPKLVSIDDGFSSLCEVAEQERRDLCIATPVKESICAIATPIKGSNYAILTPVKDNSHTKLTTSASDIELDESGNINLDSSFNSDEVFRKELELLRERFPSPMSRLLSACNVQQARSQHKKMKRERLKGDKSLKVRKQLPITVVTTGVSSSEERSPSPANVSLDYLTEQQAIISTAVDNAAYGITTKLTNPSSPGNHFSVSNSDLKQTLEKTNEPLVCTDGRILVPVSNVQLVNSNQLVQVAPNSVQLKLGKRSNPTETARVLNPSQSCTSEPTKFSEANNTTPLCKVPPKDFKPKVKYLVPVENILSQQSGVNFRGNKAVKMLINPSNTPSRYSTCFSHENQENSETKPKKMKLVKLNSGSQSTAVRLFNKSANQNFVKLDLGCVSNADSKLSLPPYKHVPKTSKVSLSLKCDARSSTNKNSSVVTNLVTRLEKQGYGSTQLYEVANSDTVTKATKKEAAPYDKVVRPQPKRPRTEVIPRTGSTKEALAVPFDENNCAFVSDWDESASAFRMASRVSNQTSTPVVKRPRESSSKEMAYQRISASFSPVVCSDQSVSSLHKRNYSDCGPPSRSVGSTPISFQSSSRSSSKSSSLSDLENLLPPSEDIFSEEVQRFIYEPNFMDDMGIATTLQLRNSNNTPFYVEREIPIGKQKSYTTTRTKEK